MVSSFPLTELIRAFPLYMRKAFSIASGLEVSICNGKGRMD